MPPETLRFGFWETGVRPCTPNKALRRINHPKRALSPASRKRHWCNSLGFNAFRLKFSDDAQLLSNTTCAYKAMRD